MAEGGATITGGERLTSRLQQMAENAGEGGTLRVGFLEKENTSGVSIPMIAAIQEFGAPRAGIPPRPFFRTMIKEQSPGWGHILATVLPAVDYHTDKALGAMGDEIGQQLRESIIALTSPPLSPVTLMIRKLKIGHTMDKTTFAEVLEARRRVARGESAGGVSTKPLIDTGQMLASVAYEIEPPS